MSKKLPPIPPPKPKQAQVVEPVQQPEPQQMPAHQQPEPQMPVSPKATQPSRSTSTGANSGWGAKPAISPRQGGASSSTTTPRKPVPVTTSRVPQWTTKAAAKCSADHCKMGEVKDIFDTMDGLFTITLRDQYDAEWSADVNVLATINTSNGRKAADCQTKQNGDRVNCSFSPLQPGNYQVDILIENEVLSGSPFSFKVYEDDATISEGGTGFPENIKEFHVAQGQAGVWAGDDKDERNEWTALANKAQSQKGEIANKIIKQHTRLIRISGKGKGITMSNVPVCGESLCNNEVFILDMGPIVYQWDGETAGIFLKNKANWYLKMLKDERQGKFKLTILQHDDNDDAFYEALGGKPDSIREIDDSIGWSPILYRVTATKKGNLHFKEVASGVGQVLPTHLKTRGVFLYDLGFEISLWEGKQAFKGLRELAIEKAGDLFKKEYNKGDVLVTRVKEGGLNPVFNAFIGGM